MAKAPNHEILKELESKLMEFADNMEGINAFLYPTEAKIGRDAIIEKAIDEGANLDAFIFMGMANDYDGSMREMISLVGSGMDLVHLFYKLLRNYPDLKELLITALEQDQDESASNN